MIIAICRGERNKTRLSGRCLLSALACAQRLGGNPSPGRSAAPGEGSHGEGATKQLCATTLPFPLPPSFSLTWPPTEMKAKMTQAVKDTLSIDDLAARGADASRDGMKGGG